MNKNPDLEIIETMGRDATLKLMELTDAMPESGKCPFIIGSRDSLGLLNVNYERRKITPREIIEAAQSLDINALFEKLKQSVLPGPEETEFDITKFQGKWKMMDSPRDLGLDYYDFITAHSEIGKRMRLDRCFIGLVPTTQSWQIPAFVSFGSWNACPSPMEHCRILQYWQEKYGAEIISLGGDVIECRVENPPQTEEECFELAWQQFAYCSDNVYQGAGTIGALASKLRNADYWYFWWD